MKKEPRYTVEELEKIFWNVDLEMVEAVCSCKDCFESFLGYLKDTETVKEILKEVEKK